MTLWHNKASECSFLAVKIPLLREADEREGYSLVPACFAGSIDLLSVAHIKECLAITETGSRPNGIGALI
jgi:hypothetical protein